MCRRVSWPAPLSTPHAAPTVVRYFYRDKGREWKPFDLKPRVRRHRNHQDHRRQEVAPIVRQKRASSTVPLSHQHPSRSAAGRCRRHSRTRRLRDGTAGSCSFGGGVRRTTMGRGLGDDRHRQEVLLEDRAPASSIFRRAWLCGRGRLLTRGLNNDDVKSAETVAVKEHFIEEFGPPLFTIGRFAPRRFDAATDRQQLPRLARRHHAARSYPDAMSFLQPLYDCELLGVSSTPPPANGPPSRRRGGRKYWGYCVSNGTRHPNARPESCDAAEEAVADDPAEGEGRALPIRTTWPAPSASTPTPVMPAALRQCRRAIRLQALNDGKISFDQFIEVNARAAVSMSTARCCSARPATHRPAPGL